MESWLKKKTAIIIGERDGVQAPSIAKCMEAAGAKVVRGGSFYDRPKRAHSAFRQDYPSWQQVFNVGFRVVMDIE